MKKAAALTMALCGVTLTICPARATSSKGPHELSLESGEVDIVGDIGTAKPSAQTVLQDTVWIADWSFDAAGACDETSWSKIDNRILNDGRVYWEVTSAFDGTGGISGNAAALGYNDNVCCVEPNGYDNDWYQAIRIEYTGAASLSFDYLLDSQLGHDFLRVETDSACASFEHVDYASAPNKVAASFRRVEFAASGLDLGGSILGLSLTDYGTGTHCVYIALFSDGGSSPCDGDQTTSIGEAVVIDDVSITDAGGTRTESFADGSLDIGLFANIQDSEPFGQWARTFRHITDNDFCTENRTCAWLWTDDTTPTIANDPGMAFGPGGYVVRNWLDDIIVGPWLTLAGTPQATGTLLQFRLFGGNPFNRSRIVQNWSVRGRKALGGTVCVSRWGHASQWNSLNYFQWLTITWDMSPNFDPVSSDIQIRFRTSDWQWITGATAPLPFIPGPGPYVDRIRIGRRSLSGPVIIEGVDARSQAQDAFPTEIFPTSPGTGEHFRPTMNRFGNCAFSSGDDLAGWFSPNLITGDSVSVQVVDVRGAGGIAAVEWYGAIVQGPHAGKAPAPWIVGANGFFVVPALLWRPGWGFRFVDLDDTYFRGGDVLYYFWLARDALGGVSSDPAGLSAVPASIAEAESATRGLLEVSFLPTIDWDPSYLARVAADPHGDLDPTAGELANSAQRNCVLYVQFANLRRRSGDANRTSFMYTLDRLGYRDHYDVYDHMGLGDTNNHLGGRATVEQAEGYNLIVYDAGNLSPSGLIMPDGSVGDSERIDQAGWFHNWLARVSTSEAGFATLWILGSNVLEERPASPLYNSDMGVLLISTDQALNLNPDVDGVGSFAFDRGTEQATADFTADLFSLNGGCPVIRNYDALGAAGTALVTHRYRDPLSGALGDGAIVMNRNASDNWNTILQSHPWFDIRDPAGTPGAPPVELVMLEQILNAVLPTECQQNPNPVDVPGAATSETPRATALYQNVPNPFNPMTTIPFDLAISGHVSLQIYDVAGRLVRTLLDEVMPGGRRRRVVWDGRDQSGGAVGSGIYFCRLQTSEDTQSRKMLVMR